MIRRTFVALHATLGVVVFVQSVLAVLTATLSPWASEPNGHVAILASVEAIGAVLFLIPRTLGIGGSLLLATFALAFVAHTLQGELAGTLLVYAAATGFVMAHGSAWRVTGQRHMPPTVGSA